MLLSGGASFRGVLGASCSEAIGTEADEDSSFRASFSNESELSSESGGDDPGLVSNVAKLDFRSSGCTLDPLDLYSDTFLIMNSC